MSQSESPHRKEVHAVVEAAVEVLEATRSGRPRDSSRDTAILEAALELVAEVGYERVSMDAVAARAHASKATIYRRWDSKASLIAAAVECRASETMNFPDLGSFRADLLGAVTMMADGMSGQDLGLLTGLFAGMRSDPELAENMRCGMFAEKMNAITALCDRSVARGEATKANAAELFHEVAPALVMHQLLIVGGPTDSIFLQHLVDDVLVPILTC